MFPKPVPCRMTTWVRAHMSPCLDIRGGCSLECIGLAQCLATSEFATEHDTKVSVAYLGIPEVRTRWFSTMCLFLASSCSFGVHAHCSSAMATYATRPNDAGSPFNEGFAHDDLHRVFDIYGRANSLHNMIAGLL